MPITDTSDKFSQLRKGLLEFVVLKVVSAHKVYVADIITLLEPTDFGAAEGTLYPLLSRLRREKLVDYEWIESESGPPRKYYHLTAGGKTQLKNLEEYWQQLNHTLTQLGAKQ